MRSTFRVAGSVWLPIFFAVVVPLAHAQGGEDVDVQTSGPVHEGFATPTVFDEGDPYYVDVDPPALIEETPPLVRPAGGAEWVPGYWSYDDDRRAWMWVSGTWRVPPPSHVWVSGYWIKTWRGWRYVPGYWATVAYATGDIMYLPASPPTLDNGPIGYAPWPNAIWVPGNWIWVGGGYLGYMWRPGYWIQAQADWIWIPATYQWTPYGYIYVEGHWDFACEHRGLLFAPVFFHRNVYLSPGFYFSPAIVINISIFSVGFFTRPAYGHYYFGDYYAQSWWGHGIYPAYSFHYSRYGYDPLYAHAWWKYGKGDPGWVERHRKHYHHLRENESERPPRTLVEQAKRRGPVKFLPGIEAPASGASAVSLKEASTTTHLKVDRLPDSERGKLVAQTQEMRRARAERIRNEGQSGPIPEKSPTNPRAVKSTGIVPGALIATAAAGGALAGGLTRPEIPKTFTELKPQADAKPVGMPTRLRDPSPDGPATDRGDAKPPVRKPDDRVPVKKPGDVRKPGDVGKPDVTPPARKPEDLPPVKKPDDRAPVKKPGDVRKPGDVGKPDVTPPARKPEDLPPVKKPGVGKPEGVPPPPPTKDPRVMPPQKPGDKPRVVKPGEQPESQPVKKPAVPRVRDPKSGEPRPADPRHDGGK